MDSLNTAELQQFTRMALFLAKYADGNMDTVELHAFQMCIDRFAYDLGVERSVLTKQADAVMHETKGWGLEKYAGQFMADAIALKNKWRGQPRLRRYYMELENLSRADRQVKESEKFVLEELRRIWGIADLDEALLG